MADTDRKEPKARSYILASILNALSRAKASIPVSILEALFRARISSSQYAICINILRYTYGWQNRGECNIAIDQLSEQTGRSRASIQRDIASLIEMNIVQIVNERRYKRGREARINPDISTWKVKGLVIKNDNIKNDNVINSDNIKNDTSKLSKMIPNNVIKNDTPHSSIDLHNSIEHNSSYFSDDDIEDEDEEMKDNYFNSGIGKIILEDGSVYGEGKENGADGTL